MKGGVKGKRKRGGGQGTGYISNLLSWSWTVEDPQGWAKGFINQKTKRLIEH